MNELDLFLHEDLGDVGDITSNALFTHERGRASISAKEGGILAGALEAKEIFERLGCDASLFKGEGETIEAGEGVMEVRGPIRSILGGERLALNFLGRMSGIATLTRDIVQKAKRVNPKVRIAATRKTTPGFRRWEKRAVEVGGGEPHRMGLWDEVLIKDNHIIAVGSIDKAIKIVKDKIGDKMEIEVEVRDEKEALAASRLEADVIMLDNISPSEGKRVSDKIKSISPKTVVEVSGGIDDRNVMEYAPFADRISCGCLTHSAKWLDFSLEMIEA
jgi:nicotinate-nucleotide pyrophosphorylase (carboxylating)